MDPPYHLSREAARTNAPGGSLGFRSNFEFETKPDLRGGKGRRARVRLPWRVRVREATTRSPRAPIRIRELNASPNFRISDVHAQM